MKLLRRMIRKEAGQVLPMALILLLLGGIIIIPTLSFATTNLKATRNIDLHTRQLYAADAGVEDAMWYLQSDNRSKIINPTLQWPKQYRLRDFQPNEQVNSKEVQVNISTAWLLKNLPGYNLPASEPVAPTNANGTWTVIGAINISDNTTYIVNISTSELGTGTAGYVGHIGVWMPQAYSYYPASVTINSVSHSGNSLVNEPNPAVPFRGGKAYIWTYPANTTFKQLSDIAPPPPGGGVTPAQKFPPSIQLAFKYTITPFKEAAAFYPWIYLSTGGRIAWDTTAGFYHIVSTSITNPSENTTVEAYVPKGMRRYIGGTGGASSAVQGDYIVIGNSLMTCCWQRSGSSGHYVYTLGPPCSYADPDNDRGKQFSESSATVNNPNTVVPSDARIEKVYLYWTAWWNTNDADKSATLKVNGTLVGTNGTVTANRWYVSSTGSGGYQYACFADVTDNVTAITTALVGSPPTSFTVSGVSAVPAAAGDGSWQYSNAAWSMIIIYSSQQPGVGVHQIYVYDQLAYLGGASGYSEEFTITGFQAPATGNRDAKLSYFIAEGDPQISKDYFEFQGQHTGIYVQLGDLADTTPTNQSNTNPHDNVYNGFSYTDTRGFTPSTLAGQAAGTISGVDLDVYTQDMNGNLLSAIIWANDTQAKVRVRAPRCTLPSPACQQSGGSDGIMLVYMVFSVASTAVTPGTEFNVGSMSYRIQ